MVCHRCGELYYPPRTNDPLCLPCKHKDLEDKIRLERWHDNITHIMMMLRS